MRAGAEPMARRWTLQCRPHPILSPKIGPAAQSPINIGRDESVLPEDVPRPRNDAEHLMFRQPDGALVRVDPSPGVPPRGVTVMGQ